MTGGADAARVIDLVGGIAAFNEEARVELAIRSLLDQTLPPGARWTRVWVAVSGSTDRTREVVDALAAEDPRIGMIFDPTRRGKSAALAEMFRRIEGDYLVLLDADSTALPHAVEALLQHAAPGSGPFAVMGHPVPPPETPSPLADELRVLYALHHRFHEWSLGQGAGTHLADNLLLLPIRHLPPLSAGIVNDGAFTGAWLARSGGRRLYAPEARVEVEVPLRFTDHLAQRRRIRCGHRQVGDLLGMYPSTLQRFALRYPGTVSRLIWHTIRQERRGLRAFLVLGALELMAWALAQWDQLPPRKDHTLWVTIGDPLPSPGHTAGSVRRISATQAPSDRAG